MSLSNNEKIFIGLIVVLFVAALVFALWNVISPPQNVCRQLGNALYKGRGVVQTQSSNNEVYYALNFEKNLFETFGTGFNVISAQVDNILSDTFTVEFDYGQGQKVLTEFRRGSTLDSADVILYPNEPKSQRISLQLVSIADWGQTLRTATTLSQQPVTTG
jgi:hypothetical protein|eukprot:COSAG01_NODE_1716_length_9403_cov_4.038697_8_plen_161_part_00